ncbi:MAG: SDR family NAD(P)-dependent oxidoreductase [Alphaproteobacteria bacterium]|nr:SDR family NAD(P)-dependent oxidoreductase [Alphaproteobacteria bacterium]
MWSVVVTGASSGIGRATAAVLVAKGYRVFGSVRDRAAGDRIAGELGDRFIPLRFDVTSETELRAAETAVRDALQGTTLAGLVNNAGIAIPGPLLHQPLEVFRRHIEVNLIGAFTVTQAFLPLLGADRALQGPPGRIVNVSTLGGAIGAPLLAGYCSSKHGLEGLSECLRRELMIYGIDVVVVAPGAIKTPIWDKAQAFDTSIYGRTDYGPAMQKLQAMLEDGNRSGLSAEQVGELIHTALTVPKPRVRYVLTRAKFMNWILPGLLPKRWVDRIAARRLGIDRKLT